MDSLILISFIPEIFLSFIILLQLICNINVVTSFKYNFPLIEKELFFQIYFILIIILLLLVKVKIEGFFSNLLLINDLAASQIKIIFIFSALFLLIIVWQSYSFQNLNFFEFFILFFFVILASLLLVSCYDFLSTYLILELQALCFYILAGIKRNSTFSSEAALKYFITGSFFSCIFLFGVSLIYGELGTTNFYYLYLLFQTPIYLQQINNLIIIAFFFILITLFFKLAVVPFHFWVSDVYDGSPLSSTIIFSVLPKIVLFTLFIRFLLINSEITEYIQFFLSIFGILSIILGTLYALKQKRLKKLFIYSSIAQIGYLIASLSVFSNTSLTSIYFFLIVYNITSVVSWGSLTSLYTFQKQFTLFKLNKNLPFFLSDLSNLFFNNKFWGVIFIFLFFSIAGIPPFLGFISKFYILFSIIIAQNLILAALILLITSFSAFYYIRILKIIFFELNPTKKNYSIFLGTFNYLNKDVYSTILCICLFLILVLFFYPTTVLLISKYITIGFFLI